MPACQGYAAPPVLDVRFHGHVKWGYLDAFTQGYILALIRAETESLLDQAQSVFLGGWGNENHLAFDLLDGPALAKIIDDCARYRREWIPSSHRSKEEQGADFWAIRQAQRTHEGCKSFAEHGFPRLTVEFDRYGKICIA